MNAASCPSCGAGPIDRAGRCEACGAVDAGAWRADPSVPDYTPRTARKAWPCHGAGNNVLSPGCSGVILPGDRCIEVLDEAPAYHSGPRVCATCASTFYGIDLTTNERNR